MQSEQFGCSTSSNDAICRGARVVDVMMSVVIVVAFREEMNDHKSKCA